MEGMVFGQNPLLTSTLLKTFALVNWTCISSTICSGCHIGYMVIKCWVWVSPAVSVSDNDGVMYCKMMGFFTAPDFPGFLVFSIFCCF